MYDPKIGRWLSQDPIGFSAGDANLYRYVFNDPVNETDPTGQYEKDVHFYMTYYIGLIVGLGNIDSIFLMDGHRMSAAYMIAWADQFTDDHPVTGPFASEDARLRYHFRHSRGHTVSSASDVASQVVNQAIAAKNSDLLLMGIGLHAFQDSFAHAGYTHHWGHAFDAHDPDLCYLSAFTVQRALTVADETRDKLIAFGKANYPDTFRDRTGNWPRWREKLKKLLSEGHEEWNWGWFGDADDLQDRCQVWWQAIKSDYRSAVDYQPVGIGTVWEQMFSTAAASVSRP
jgi:hypothetical protein